MDVDREAAGEAAHNHLWDMIYRYVTVTERGELPDAAINAVNAAITAHTEAAVKGPSQEWWNLRSLWYQGECSRLETQIADLTARLANQEKERTTCDTAIHQSGGPTTPADTDAGPYDTVDKLWAQIQELTARLAECEGELIELRASLISVRCASCGMPPWEIKG